MMEAIKEQMKEITDLTTKLMDIIDQYEITKASSMSYTKIEEAILWMQVMVSQTHKKAAKPENE